MQTSLFLSSGAGILTAKWFERKIPTMCRKIWAAPPPRSSLKMRICRTLPRIQARKPFPPHRRVLLTPAPRLHDSPRHIFLRQLRLCHPRRPHHKHLRLHRLCRPFLRTHRLSLQHLRRKRSLPRQHTLPLRPRRKHRLRHSAKLLTLPLSPLPCGPHSTTPRRICASVPPSRGEKRRYPHLCRPHRLSLLRPRSRRPRLRRKHRLLRRHTFLLRPLRLRPQHMFPQQPYLQHLRRKHPFPLPRKLRRPRRAFSFAETAVSGFWTTASSAAAAAHRLYPLQRSEPDELSELRIFIA